MSLSKHGEDATEIEPLLGKKEPVDDVEFGDTDGKKEPSTTDKISNTVLEDIIDILKLAFPIFITSFSWVGVSSNKLHI